MPLFTWGNKKLPKTTAIFNMTPATVCPSHAHKLCQLAQPTKHCYALKAERMYKNALIHRMNQMEFWKDCTAKSFVLAFMAEKKRKAVNTLRFNESGDFVSQNSVVKAETIASILYNQYGILTYCYTARRDLDLSIRKHLIINGSGFMVDNGFFVIKKGHSPKLNNRSKLVCPQDCRICSICSKRKKATIYAFMH